MKSGVIVGQEPLAFRETLTQTEKKKKKKDSPGPESWGRILPRQVPSHSHSGGEGERESLHMFLQSGAVRASQASQPVQTGAETVCRNGGGGRSGGGGAVRHWFASLKPEANNISTHSKYSNGRQWMGTKIPYSCWKPYPIQR